MQWQRWSFLAAACGLACAALLATAQQPAAPPAPEGRGTENSALALAMADLLTLSHEEQLLVRHVWITSDDPGYTLAERVQRVALVLNYLSQASVALKPLPIAKGNTTLVRVEIAHPLRSGFAPRQPGTDKWVRTWEELQFDPRFSILLTQDTLRFAGLLDIEIPKAKKSVKRTVEKVVQRKVKVAPYQATDGKTYDYQVKDETVTEEVTEVVEGPAFSADTVVLRLFNEKAIDKKLYAACVDLTQSQAPVVSDDYLLFRGLSTIQDKDGQKDTLYSTLFGGLYYQFQGIERSKDKGKTDEDLLLERLGVIGGSAQYYGKLRSDQRGFLMRSDVTGKPRGCLFAPHAGTRVSAGQGLVVTTLDVKQKSIDIGQRAFLNLLDFKADAKEVIFTNLFGLHGFVLFNGDGALQDAAPIDVVSDYEVPRGERAELQGAISCIRCHGRAGGWQPFKSDAQKLIKNGLDVFGDLSAIGLNRFEVADRIAGLYSLDPEQKVLPGGRDSYATAVLRCTGPWPHRGKGDQTDIVATSAEAISKGFSRYWYEGVDAQRALADLGEVAPKDPKDAEKAFGKLVPVLVQREDVARGFVPEDGRVAALRNGLKLVPTDWLLVRGFVAARAARTRLIEAAKVPQKKAG